MSYIPRSKMFADVIAMNLAFNNPPGNPAAIDWERVRNQCKSIPREHKEMNDAITDVQRFHLGTYDGPLSLSQLIDKVRDGLCDIIVFTLGAQFMMGADADLDMAAVVDGVMTRFCKTQDELDMTLTYWRQRGLTNLYTEGEFPRVCVKSGADQVDNTGDTAPKGKFLKAINYREPVFAPLPPFVVVPLDRPLPARRYMGQAL